MGFVRVVVLHGDDGHHVVGPILRTTIRYGASGRAGAESRRDNSSVSRERLAGRSPGRQLTPTV